MRKELVPVGESTERKPVRIDGGRVVLVVDSAVPPERGGTAAVSPARALELLDGLQDLRHELQQLVTAQQRQSMLRRAVELVLSEPLLAGWSNISEKNYNRDRGDYVSVLYFEPENLERYAEQAGCEVVRTQHPNVDLLDVWIGSVEQGWIALHCQYGYYPDGRPEPAEEQAAKDAALDAAISELDDAGGGPDDEDAQEPEPGQQCTRTRPHAPHEGCAGAGRIVAADPDLTFAGQMATAGRVRCIARPTGDRCALCGATGLTGPEHFEPAADSAEVSALADRLAGGEL